MPGSRRLGSDAEDTATRFLIDLGFTIISRRCRTRSGELDIVALDGETLVLVEVKSTQSSGGAAADRVTARKLSRWQLAAQEYIADVDWRGPARFDLIAITPTGLTHYPGVI